jgi:hypothetical protein
MVSILRFHGLNYLRSNVGIMFMYGPFDSPPFDNYRVSSLEVAEGKYSKKKRLILDLSSPHQSENHCSINDLIDKDTCSMSYVKIDNATDIILKYGKNSWLCKYDISNALKIVPLLLLNGLCFVLNGIRYSISMFV